MASLTLRTVYLRDDVRWCRDSVLGFSSGVIANLSALDALCVRLLMCGASDHTFVAQTLAASTGSQDVEYWQRRVTQIARQDGSAISVRSVTLPARPSTIVVDLTSSEQFSPGLVLARALAGGAGTWFVTAMKREAQRASRFATPIWAERIGSPFAFLQWIRSLAVRLPDIPIVLCGEVDAVCVGETASRGTVLALVDGSWPGGAPITRYAPLQDAQAEAREVLDEFYYAAAGTREPEEIASMGRVSGSSFGALEAWALLGASRVIYRTRGQALELEALGVTRSRLGIAAMDKQPNVESEGERDAFLILAGPECMDDRMLGVAEWAGALKELPGISFVALYSGGKWYEFRATPAAVHVLRWFGQAPALSRFRAAIGLSGVFSEHAILPNLIAAGCRLWFTPTREAEPHLGCLPASVWLEGSPAEWITRVASDGTDSLWEQARTALLERWKLARIVNDIRATAV
jgi:hypothetical protein